MVDRSGETIARYYEQAHGRIVELVSGIDEQRASTVVPGTPKWTVHDLVAHLVAIPGELAAGTLKGIPGPDETQAMVEERRGRGIPALLAEWRVGLVPTLEAARAGMIPPPLAVDAITHEQDLRGALGASPVPDDDAVIWAASGFAMGFGHRLKGEGLAPLRLHDPASGFEAKAGEGDPEAMVSAPVFEFFRAMAGRRSRLQVEAFDWDCDCAPYLDVFCVFGPLREEDLHDA